MGDVLSPPAFWPPCNIQNFLATNRWASFFQLFQHFQLSAKNRWASFFQLFQLFQLSAKNRQDIQPSTRPRINISQVPAGRFLFFFFCFSLSCSVFLRVFICVLFDCKCKSLKRLGENIKQQQKETEKQQNNFKKNINNRNTGYPALDPTANKYISGSGLDISVVVLLFVCFSVVFLFFILNVFYMCVVRL